MKKHDDYDVLDFGTSLIPGAQIKIEHSVSSEKADLSDLISRSAEELQAMREESAASEQKAYEIILSAVHQWEKQAAVTQRIDRAIQYQRIPAAQHTSNEWVQGENGEKTISNMVYKMTCRIKDDSHWDLWKSQGYKPCWSVRWGVYTNSPKRHGSVGIAGQTRVFKDQESAEKYLRGRIKAYAHLFTEISPQIPKEYDELFRVNNQLLPGYRSEAEPAPVAHQEKASVLEKLSTVKSHEKTAASKIADKKKEDIHR